MTFMLMIIRYTPQVSIGILCSDVWCLGGFVMWYNICMANFFKPSDPLDKIIAQTFPDKKIENTEHILTG